MDVDDNEDIVRLLLQHRQDLFTRVLNNMNEWQYRFPPSLSDEEWWPRPERDPRTGVMRTKEEVFDQVYNYIVSRGVAVRTKVEWLVTHAEYRRLERRWNPDRNQYEDYYEGLGGSPTGPWDPLLAITVEPRSGLNPFPVARHRDHPEPFHFSIGHYWELGPDIYDRGGIMEGLLRTLHNKTIHLKMDPTQFALYHDTDRTTGQLLFDENGQPVMRRQTGLQLDRNRDPIATNPYIIAARARSERHGRRDPHISL